MNHPAASCGVSVIPLNPNFHRDRRWDLVEDNYLWIPASAGMTWNLISRSKLRGIPAVEGSLRKINSTMERADILPFDEVYSESFDMLMINFAELLRVNKLRTGAGPAPTMERATTRVAPTGYMPSFLIDFTNLTL